MKKLLTLLFLSTFLFSFSQQKELSIEDSVLGYYKGLYPTSLHNLHWITNTDSYIFQQDEKFVITDARTNTVIKNITLTAIQEAFPNLNRLPALQETTATNFTFRKGNTIENFNYST